MCEVWVNATNLTVNPQFHFQRWTSHVIHRVLDVCCKGGDSSDDAHHRHLQSRSNEHELCNSRKHQGFKYPWIRHTRLVSKGYTWGMVLKGSSSQKTDLFSSLACLFTLLAWQLKQQVHKTKQKFISFGNGLDFSVLLRQKEPHRFDATLSITSCAASLQRS